MKRFTGKALIFGAAAVLLAIAGCSSGGSGGTASYKIGGTVTGLIGTLVLQNNGADDLSVTASGTFSFAKAIANGSSYSVTVKTQPAAQACTVTNGSGKVSSANVTNVAVSCASTYTVGGTVTGLIGTLVLQNNGADDLSATASGPFTFATVLTNGSSYSVTVKTQPASQTCTVTNGSGKVSSANVTDVSIGCHNSGSLDTSFSTDGKVTTAFGTSNDVATSVAIQSDGKIVAAGYSYNGANYDFALVRYNMDGSLDSTFGTGGKVTTAFGTGDDGAKSVAIQSDGKIVAAGYSDNGANYDFALVRYNTDGSLDSTFGTGGKVTTAVGTGTDNAKSVAIQSDGKIVAAGYSYNGANFDFALVRYNTDGSLDSTFGTGGKVTTAFGTSNDEAYSVAIQSDGKIVAAGSSNNGANYDFALVRYWP